MTVPHWACPQGLCEAIIDPPAVEAGGRWKLPDGGALLEGGGEKGGYDPKDLQAAYTIPVSGGEAQEHYEETQTIALVDAGFDATAESDLAEYRKHYGLPPCSAASGCFRQVNERGETGSPPPPDDEWEVETALDLDMASAACPHCHILLVESTEETLADLAEAANTAAQLGASEISNSYGLPELNQSECGESSCRTLNGDYDHPGVVVTASAGDGGYVNDLRGGTSPLFPAASPYVIAVGGTSLHKVESSSGRKWSEAVWLEESRSIGTGSGCSSTESKPAWQTDKGCEKRTDNDVAAVAACETPVSIYSSASGGWENVCGTSASSPLMAGIEAHSREHGAAVPTSDAFYQDRASLYNVTKGHDGSCTPEYLCSAEKQEAGYDGPAGNGTPASGPVTAAGEPPSVRSEVATAVGATASTLNGVIDPNGLATTYRFEYGTTTSYGASVPAAGASAGSGANAVGVNQELSGLVPNTTYHFRLAATNADGTVDGLDQSFHTAPPTVSSVKPTTGPSVGGNAVTIGGTNFAGVIAVRFGQTAAANVIVNSESSITATPPSGSGTVDVTVTTGAGTSAKRQADEYAYYHFESLFAQPGTELAATGENGEPDLGDGVALSTDGNTAIVGGGADAKSLGAAWVFVRSGSTWAQQGEKLTASGEAASGEFGASVAVSANGNVAIIGSPGEKSGTGSAWVFTRSAGVWKQQAKLTGGSESGAAGFGRAVALSAEGNTAIVGGGGDNEHRGAVWIFTRSGTTWSQQGSKLTGAGESGTGEFGYSVSLSGDGNTAIVGAPVDFGSHNLRETGGAWIYTRSGSAWSQQGEKLSPVGAVGPSQFGIAVALSAEGTTAMVTGDRDAEFKGAAWVYTRSGSIWSAQGEKLTPVGESGKASFGYAAALSAEGNIALIGGASDNGDLGAAWAFRRGGSAWSQAGAKLTGTGEGGAAPEFGDSVSLSGEGTTALAGARFDHGAGAVWTFATPAPAVTEVTPNHGGPWGGVPVTITGTHLLGAKAVRFGSTPASSFAVLASNEIKAFSPPGSGAVDVTVETAAGTSATGPSDHFTFVTPKYSPGSLFSPGGGPTDSPTGIAVNQQGDVWVSQWYANTVEELSQTGTPIRSVSLESPCSGQLHGPWGLALDAQGNLWVADSANNRILKFSPEGKCELQVGVSGAGNGQFDYPTSIAVGPNGAIWVADMFNQRIQELNGYGEYLGQIGSGGAFGSGPGEFLLPEGVAVDARGDVWVSEPFNNRVRELSEKGEYLGQVNALFPEGEAVAASPEGTVWIADGSDVMRELNANREVLAQLGSAGSGEGQLEGSGAIAADTVGDVWVADEAPNRLQEWKAE